MTHNTIMIVEDDEDLREALAETLELSDYAVIQVKSAEDAIVELHKAKPAMVVTDIRMNGMGGYGLLDYMNKNHDDIPVLLITAYAAVTDAVAAIQKGAKDYLVKPFEPKDLLKKIKQFANASTEAAVVAADPKSQELLSLARKVAKTDATVMISGNSGTGKEVLARYIHSNSNRSDKPFVAINCAAIPDNMLEATLFGYEKGAFTGAQQAYAGKFEQAQSGTLLLDEITEMDLSLQAKLLRVLQEREVERLGGKKTIQLDVRVLATSNRDLQQAVKNVEFREDLYFRLNVFPLRWPALKDRPKDIVPLAEYLLSYHAKLNNRANPELSASAQDKLLAHGWPGNARELDNVIQRCLILQLGESIEADDIQFDFDSETSTAVISKDIKDSEIKAEKLGDNLKVKEQQIIVTAMEEHKGDRKMVAEALGVSPRTLRYKLAKLREHGVSF